MPYSHAWRWGDLPPSGHQRATDLGDLNPRSARVNFGFPASGYSPRRAQMKTQDASKKPASTATCAQSSQIRRGLSQLWMAKQRGYWLKWNRRNTDVSDPILLHFCIISPVSAPPKCPGLSALLETRADLRLKGAFGDNDSSQTWTHFRHSGVHVYT